MSGIIGGANQNENQNQNQNEGVDVGIGLLPLISAVRRPMGVVPSPHLTDLGFYAGEKWPPATDKPVIVMQDGKTVEGKLRSDQLFYPGSPWSADYVALAILTEFAQQTDWHKIDLPKDQVEKSLDGEIQLLLKLMDYRAGVVAEALSQCNAIDDYFRGVLSFSAGSHPKTNCIVQTALRVGEFQVMHYKSKYKRPRPSRLSPMLMPLIEVPGHGSFPSGHATQSKLIALCLKAVLPVEAGPFLKALAQRVARNREVLGLHYPSDSIAGRYLAKETYKLLVDKCPTFSVLIDKARAEWGLCPIAPKAAEGKNANRH